MKYLKGKLGGDSVKSSIDWILDQIKARYNKPEEIKSTQLFDSIFTGKERFIFLLDSRSNKG